MYGLSISNMITCLPLPFIGRQIDMMIIISVRDLNDSVPVRLSLESLAVPALLQLCSCFALEAPHLSSLMGRGAVTQAVQVQRSPSFPASAKQLYCES